MAQSKKRSEFEKAAQEEARGGFFRELWGFMKENKKWWLLPLVMALLLFGLLVVLSGTGLAPFIYTLF
jgi:drug/metabolite transporter superfamily protein YnfA